MLVATNGTESHRVYISHWWPGRLCRLPNIDMVGFRKAVRDGSIYLTTVSADLNGIVVSAHARCCPKDHPSRAKGRFIALLRLARFIRPMGYKLQSV